MRNLEIKIGLTAAQFKALERAVRAAGVPITVLDQIDTYFVTERGRLKLRRITSEEGVPTAELISYQRPDLPGPRWSGYELLPLAPEAAARLGSMLEAAVGVATTVRKRRLVAIRGRSRIHLDQVAKLGCFLEIESIATDDDDTGVDRELQATLEWLGVDPATVEPIQGSYADLRRG